MNETTWLTDEVIAEVADHMNDDHLDDNVVICRGLGGAHDVVAARFTDMTATTAVFTATTTDGSEREVRVPFANPVAERPDIRAEVADLYHRSVDLLGPSARETH